MPFARPTFVAIGLALAVGFGAPGLAAEQIGATGQSITPDAAPGALFQPLNPDLPEAPGYTAGQASALALSPDGRTLLIVTSGYNLVYGDAGKPLPDLSREYVFVYDVSGPAPVKRQVIKVPNTFLGLVWAPSGDRFYVSGGVDDDVLEYAGAPGAYALARTVKLGHGFGVGLVVQPEAGPLAISPDGRRLLVANVQNDSVSLIDLASGKVTDQDLRPGVIDPGRRGQPGGSFPRGVAWASDDKAYVTSERDREIIALKIEASRVVVAARLKTIGQPIALIVNRARTRLYAALDNTDGVEVVDTRTDRPVERIATLAPAGVAEGLSRLGGAGSNALALSPDGRGLLVTNGGENDLAVIHLDARAAGVSAARRGRASARSKVQDDDDDPRPADRSAVVGLIPTGWSPTGVAVRPDGRRIFVINGKSPPGANPGNCRVNTGIDPHHDDACRATNSYVWQIQKAGFLTLPPPTPAQLGKLTRQVAENDHYPSAAHARSDAALFAFLRQHIHHVIYIVKENRTYDQVLGDLEVGNGDPKLTVFGRAMTPNQHALARGFVDLDAFYDSGESSNTGWDWTTAARTDDWTEREAPVNYAARGLQYDQEGANRNINVGYATSAERVKANPVSPAAPDVLPGAIDVAAPDGPGGEEGRGYIWDAALRGGLSVRNYGFFGDLTRYEEKLGPFRIPRDREPWKSGLKVFYVTKPALMPVTDPYFRGFDQGFPDYWRFKEWEREFDGFIAAGKAPGLMLVRLPHDHTGSFAEGIDGINTVETELADNDYAVGLLVDKVAKSPFAKDTLIFVIEDDAQDGPDHVDAHRSTAYIAGPYVKQEAVVSRPYNTVNMVATIEAVLGLEPTGLNDAVAAPMADVFDITRPDWSFDAKVPEILRTTTLPLPPATTAEAACIPHPRRSAAWWAAAMAGQDFSREDQLNTPAYNHALWRGLKGGEPYPVRRDGQDLRTNRAALLKASASEACPG
jgi:DNA-binding beta-propeller fold protein YncE